MNPVKCRYLFNFNTTEKRSDMALILRLQIRLQLAKYLFLLAHPSTVRSEYPCICLFDDNVKIYDLPSKGSTPIGTVHTFDCIASHNVNGITGFEAVEISNRIGYIECSAHMVKTQCMGNPPEFEKQIFKIHQKLGKRFWGADSSMQSTTAAVTLTAVARETTVSPRQTTKISSINNVIPEGHIELCPTTLKSTVNRYAGFLGQYGDYCYEYVPYQTQWTNAERHCNLVSSGHLAHIANPEEQDFLLRFLQSHQHLDRVWIGLRIYGIQGEWKWSSEANLTFNSFVNGVDHHAHGYPQWKDCTVLDSSGEWVDVPCGLSLFLGTGIWDEHAYVCQYRLNSKPPGLLEAIFKGLIG